MVIVATLVLSVALQIKPDAAAASIAQKAMLQIQAGEFQQASKLLRERLRIAPANPDLWNLLGIAQSELHQSAAAQEAFECGLAVAPESVSLNENLGLLFFKGGHYLEAKKYLGRAVQVGSQTPAVRFSLAASELRSGEPEKALIGLRSLQPMLKDVSDYWEERGRAELEKDPAGAEGSFDQALQLSPHDVNALNGAALAAEKQGLDEKALAYLIQARTLNPNDVGTLEHFGAVCIRRDLGPDALDALTHAHQLAPSDNTVLYLLARANISVQNWQEAFDLFSALSKRIPNFAPAFYAMGWIEIRLNQRENAKKQLEHCLSLAPNMPGPDDELAQLEVDDGNLDAAEKLLRSALMQTPHDAKANTLLGDILLRHGNLEGAESCLRTAVRDDPKLAAAHYKLSVLLVRKHELQESARERTTAANLSAEANQNSKTQLRLVLPDMAR